MTYGGWWAGVRLANGSEWGGGILLLPEPFSLTWQEILWFVRRWASKRDKKDRSKGRETRKERSCLAPPPTHLFPRSLPPPLVFFLFFSFPTILCRSRKERVREGEREKKECMKRKGSNLETNVCRMINCHADGVCVSQLLFSFS